MNKTHIASHSGSPRKRGVKLVNLQSRIKITTYCQSWPHGGWMSSQLYSCLTGTLHCYCRKEQNVWQANAIHDNCHSNLMFHLSQRGGLRGCSLTYWTTLIAFLLFCPAPIVLRHRHRQVQQTDLELRFLLWAAIGCLSLWCLQWAGLCPAAPPPGFLYLMNW